MQQSVEPQARRRPSRRPVLLVLGGAIALVLSLTFMFIVRVNGYFVDLAVYRGGARAWLDGSPLYGVRFPTPDTSLPFTYPPLAAIVMAPLGAVGADPAGTLMFAVSLAALVATIWLVLTRLQPGLNSVTAAGIVLLATAGAIQLEPVSNTLSYGQVNLVLMFLVTADLLVAKTWWPRGMLIGIAAAIKLTPAAFVLYFLVSRNWRGAIVTVLSAAAATGLAFALAWNDSVQYWLKGTLASTNRIGAPYYAANQSWKGVLTRFDPHASDLLWILGAVIVVIAAGVLMHRLFVNHQPVAAMVVHAIAILLCSPISWSHHWVWIVPALAIGIDAIARRENLKVTVPATVIGAVTFLVAPHWLMPNAGDLELTWKWWQQPIGDGYWVLAMAVLIGGLIFYRPASTCAGEPQPAGQ